MDFMTEDERKKDWLGSNDGISAEEFGARDLVTAGSGSPEEAQKRLNDMDRATALAEDYLREGRSPEEVIGLLASSNLALTGFADEIVRAAERTVSNSEQLAEEEDKKQKLQAEEEKRLAQKAENAIIAELDKLEEEELKKPEPKKEEASVQDVASAVTATAALGLGAISISRMPSDDVPYLSSTYSGQPDVRHGLGDENVSLATRSGHDLLMGNVTYSGEMFASPSDLTPPSTPGFSKSQGVGASR